MEGFFFIPATKIDKIQNVLKSYDCQVIIDFEDAVLPSDRESLFDFFFLQKDIPFDVWVRLPLLEESGFGLGNILTFIKKGFFRFVLPKIASKAEYDAVAKAVYSHSTNIEFILLIENPLLLLQLKELLLSDVNSMIKCVALGSHDLLSLLGAEHTLKQLNFPRYYMLYCAKAYGKKAIDIVSMDLSNENAFKEGVQEGLVSGFDAKFLLHPRQATWFKEVTQDNRLLEWARKIIDRLPYGIDTKDIEPFVLDGEVIEKPHVTKAIQILQQTKKHEE